MTMFLIMSPFAVLSLMLSFAPPAAALFAASVLAAALLIADRARGRSIKLLHIATFAITLGLCGCALALGSRFTAQTARLSLDAGLLVVILASLALRVPFTIQYAREAVDAQTAARPEFLRANDVMTSVWAATMMVMLAVDIGVRYVPWLPLWSGLAAAFAARNAAVFFTQWYGARRRAMGEAAMARAALLSRTARGVA